VACEKPPYNNLDLRLALKYAIDRDAVLKTGFRGFGKIGNDQPVPESLIFYSPDVPQRKYDPDKAKFHLKNSGYDGPIVLAASEGAFQGGMATAEIFQSNAKAAGMDFQIKPVPSQGYFATFMDHDFRESTFGGRSTADLALSAEFGADSPINESRWNNPKFEQLLVAARGETDTAKRKQMYHDLQFLAHEEGGSMIPLFTTAIEIASKNVRGYVPSPVITLGGWRGTEKIWLADS
jgi:peptide/nickel transport system substrate-binding protein